MVDLIARKAYGRHKMGDKVSLPRQDAKILIATGHMARAPEVEKERAAKRVYQRRDMVAQGAPKAAPVLPAAGYAPVAQTFMAQPDKEVPAPEIVPATVPAMTTKSDET